MESRKTYTISKGGSLTESTQSWNGWFKDGKWKDGMEIGTFTPNSTVTMIGNGGGFGPGGRGGFHEW